MYVYILPDLQQSAYFGKFYKQQQITEYCCAQVFYFLFLYPTYARFGGGFAIVFEEFVSSNFFNTAVIDLVRKFVFIQKVNS